MSSGTTRRPRRAVEVLRQERIPHGSIRRLSTIDVSDVGGASSRGSLLTGAAVGSVGAALLEATVLAFPPAGLFTKDAATIARVMVSKKVSPKGPASGIRMIQFFINRGGKNLPAARKEESRQHFPLALCRCLSCGLLQLPDVVDPELLYGNYTYFTGISLGLSEHFQRYADAVLEQVEPAAGSLVVDIGSNDGTLLKCFLDSGMRVLGVDPAAEVAKRASAAGVPTITAYFDAPLARRVIVEAAMSLERA